MAVTSFLKTVCVDVSRIEETRIKGLFKSELLQVFNVWSTIAYQKKIASFFLLFCLPINETARLIILQKTIVAN